MAPLRTTFLASIAVLGGLTLTGCTSQTQKCSNGVCDLDLSGIGAQTTLGGEGGSTVELVKASGTTAELKIAGKTGTLTVGQPVTLDNATLELVEVEGDNDVQLKLVGTPEGSTPDGSTPEGSTPSN